MITDKTKLIGLLKTEASNLGTYLDNIINQKEPELLEDWFGYSIKKDLLSASPSTEAQALIDGFEYTDDNGDLQYLTGLSDVLPYFIYYYVVRDKQTSGTNVGQVSALAENVQKVTPLQKLATNYNRGCDLINEMIWYVNDNDDTYTDVVYNGYVSYISKLGI